MVIPMSGDTKTRASKNLKRIVCDGKRIIMRTNSDSLLVIGSGNFVEVERNDGKIEVVGDGCQVCVTTGNGTIEYKGDGGYVKSGSVDMKNISYFGDGGRIVSSNGTTKHYCKNIVKSQSYEDISNKNSVKIVNGNIFVNNKSSCHIKVPNVRHSHCIHIPNISIVTCQCKHC